MPPIKKLMDAAPPMTLRLEKHVVERIDVACQKRVGWISRNTWITEAILEKLEREFPAKRQKGRGR